MSATDSALSRETAMNIEYLRRMVIVEFEDYGPLRLLSAFPENF